MRLAALARLVAPHIDFSTGSQTGSNMDEFFYQPGMGNLANLLGYEAYGPGFNSGTGQGGGFGGSGGGNPYYNANGYIVRGDGGANQPTYDNPFGNPGDPAGGGHDPGNDGGGPGIGGGPPGSGGAPGGGSNQPSVGKWPMGATPAPGPTSSAGSPNMMSATSGGGYQPIDTGIATRDPEMQNFLNQWREGVRTGQIPAGMVPAMGPNGPEIVPQSALGIQEKPHFDRASGKWLDSNNQPFSNGVNYVNGVYIGGAKGTPGTFGGAPTNSLAGTAMTGATPDPQYTGAAAYGATPASFGTANMTAQGATPQAGIAGRPSVGTAPVQTGTRPPTVPGVAGDAGPSRPAPRVVPNYDPNTTGGYTPTLPTGPPAPVNPPTAPRPPGGTAPIGSPPGYYPTPPGTMQPIPPGGGQPGDVPPYGIGPTGEPITAWGTGGASGNRQLTGQQLYNTFSGALQHPELPADVQNAMEQEGMNAARANFAGQSGQLARHVAATGNNAGYAAGLSQIGRNQAGALGQQARQNKIDEENLKRQRENWAAQGLGSLYTGESNYNQGILGGLANLLKMPSGKVGVNSQDENKFGIAI